MNKLYAGMLGLSIFIGGCTYKNTDGPGAIEPKTLSYDTREFIDPSWRLHNKVRFYFQYDPDIKINGVKAKRLVLFSLDQTRSMMLTDLEPTDTTSIDEVVIKSGKNLRKKDLSKQSAVNYEKQRELSTLFDKITNQINNQ